MLLNSRLSRKDLLQSLTARDKTNVDVRTEFDCKENIPANTTAYCLIIHDHVVQYNVVRKIT